MKVDVLSNEVFFLKPVECLHLVFYEVFVLHPHGSTSVFVRKLSVDRSVVVAFPLQELLVEEFVGLFLIKLVLLENRVQIFTDGFVLLSCCRHFSSSFHLFK